MSSAPAGTPGDDPEAASWSWTQHLRSGGTTPWLTWATSGRQTGSPPRGWVPPGAAQLEVVRLLAERRAGLDGGAFASLADVVLGRSGPGRGLAQQPLLWAADPGRHRFGPPPVDPSAVPRSELVRLAVGALASLALAAPAPPPEAARVSLRLPRRPFALAGAPLTTDAVRRALGAAGHVESRRASRVVLVAEPLDDLMAQAWSARVQRGAPVGWGGFVQRWAARPDLPPAVDVSGLARQWADRVGADQVHVVVGGGDPERVVRETGDLLGLALRRSRPGRRGGDPTPLRPLAPAAVDVVRRVNDVLGVRAPAPDRPAAVRALVTAVSASAPARRRLTVPPAHQDWARRRAERMLEELGGGGYAVHGRLTALVPDFAGRPVRARPAAVLETALEACLHGALQTSVTRAREAEAT